MGVHGKEAADQLRNKKEGDRNIQRRSSDADFFLCNHFDEPSANDDDGDAIGEHHFVVFKQFIIPLGQNEGDENKKEWKAPPYNAGTPRCDVHDLKYI